MRKLTAILVLTLAMLLQTVPAYAACVTYTINSGGRLVTCTKCCFGNHCTVNCF